MVNIKGMHQAGTAHLATHTRQLPSGSPRQALHQRHIVATATYQKVESTHSLTSLLCCCTAQEVQQELALLMVS